MRTPEQPGPSGDGDGPGPARSPIKTEAWPRLRHLDLVTIAVTLGVALLVTAPRLPPGICVGDCGGLQLACATLGITHPTGYAGYVSLGYLATLVPGVDPAYMVSLAALACGMLMLLLCILMQVRLGVGTGLACAMSMGLTAHPRVWSNLLAPEVYAPTLMFVATAAYLLTKHARRGQTRDLYLAALLFGVALANRPPVGLILPFFLVAWRLGSRHRDGSWWPSIRSLLLVTLLGALPGMYTLGYLWVRDAPDTPYNYIEQFNAENDVLPQAHDGPAARIERIVWLVSGRQFSGEMGNTWPGVRRKLRWLSNELIPGRWVSVQVMPFRFIVLSVAFVVIILATIIAYQRCQVQTLLMAGIAISSVVFVCIYRVYGDAADVLPLLFVVAVLGGVALSPVLSLGPQRWRRWLGVGLAGVACLVTVIDAPYRRDVGHTRSALEFLEQVDMPTLPTHAVICSRWKTSPPLWYARTVLFDRRDILVINAAEDKWRPMTAAMSHRPIFAITRPSVDSGFTSTPVRNLWRLEHTATRPQTPKR